MGSLLLKGWTMLDESCPDCFMPIMRNKNKQEVCPMCDREYQNKSDSNIADKAISSKHHSSK